MTLHSFDISAKDKGNHWIEGTINDFTFQAKVYAAGSKFGINGGPVSKLTVWETKKSPASAIISYDRGWDKKPETGEHKALLQALLLYL